MSQEAPDLRPERRREKREPTSGQVTMIFEDPPMTVPGTLLDKSPGGFRIQHDFQEIALNQIATIQTAGGEKRARVVWNRRLGREVQSGFIVMD